MLMADFVSGYRRWRAQQEQIRKFYVRFGFDPDSSPDTIAQDYLSRAARERDEVTLEWGRLLLDLERDELRRDAVDDSV